MLWKQILVFSEGTPIEELMTSGKLVFGLVPILSMLPGLVVAKLMLNNAQVDSSVKTKLRKIVWLCAFFFLLFDCLAGFSSFLVLQNVREIGSTCVALLDFFSSFQGRINGR